MTDLSEARDRARLALTIRGGRIASAECRWLAERVFALTEEIDKARADANRLARALRPFAYNGAGNPLPLPTISGVQAVLRLHDEQRGE